jgi:pyridoxine 5-phosphate synthase
MTCKLSVNVNAIAYLRNRRGLAWPSVTELSAAALDAGAYGITVHPRPDARHITEDDVHALSELLSGAYSDKEFNIEGNPDERFVALVEAVRPHQVTLVPDDETQITSDHGWDIPKHERFLSDVVARLKSGGMRVAIFVDAEPALAHAAKAVGADRIEIYTGPYGAATEPALAKAELAKIIATGTAAGEIGLGLNAGHDLTIENLPPMVEGLPNLAEVSIGHAITADALMHGFSESVRRFRAACGDPVV